MGQNRLISPGSGKWWALGAVVILALAPIFIASGYIRHLLVISMLYAVVAASWDMSLGYGGVFNFAHVALFAIGAYTGGILTKSLGVPPFLAILAGGVVAVAASLLVCLPVLRVKGIYVCLVTFAFGQVCLHVVRSQGELTGGNRGLVLIPPVRIGSYAFTADDKIAYYYLALLLLVVATFFLRRLLGSYFGKSIVAVRDYEEYAVSRGIPLARQRLLTFAASAVFTGMTGAVYAMYLGVVSTDLFGFGYTTTLLSMVIVGGVATTYGPILGAFLLGFLTEFMSDLGPWRYMITAVLIVLVLRYYPQGVYGGLQRLAGLLTRKRKS
jgi:branched-chain amino acid transport system permease protein